MLSASHITYYHLCHRKLWLHHRQLRMEDESAAVAVGKLIDRTSYRRRARRWQQLSLPGLKIDHFDPQERLVKETKKSAKLEHAHRAQLRYYLYRMEQVGIKGVRGLIEYPREKRRVEVLLTAEDRQTNIPAWENAIASIVKANACPAAVLKNYCRRCAFFDFCFV